MPGLGDTEFGAIEAAVRRRLAPWTDDATGRRFAVLDAPFPLDVDMSAKMASAEANRFDSAHAGDAGAAMLRYFVGLDGVANPVLRDAATNRVVEGGGRVSQLYRTVMSRAVPRGGGENAEARAALYVDGPDGLPVRSPLFEAYRAHLSTVTALEGDLLAARAEAPPDPARIEAVERRLAMARADLAVQGQAPRVEALLAALSDDDAAGRAWREARDRLEDGLVTDPATTITVPVTRCRPVPVDQWIEIDVEPPSSGPGALLGREEEVLRVQARAFPVYLDRDGWYDHSVLTRVPWDWGPVERGRVLSDGRGGGEMPLLPVAAVLMRDIRVTVRIPFELEPAEPGDAPAPTPAPKTVPTLGKMVMPLKLARIDGVRQAIDPGTLRRAEPKVALAPDLTRMRRATIVADKAVFRALPAQLSAISAKPAPIRQARPVAAVETLRRADAVAAAPPPMLRIDPSVLLRERARVTVQPTLKPVARPAAHPTTGKVRITTRRADASGAWTAAAMKVEIRDARHPDRVRAFAETGADGSVERDLPPGRWTLTVAAGAEERASVATVDVRAGARHDADLTVSPRWREVEMTACGEGEGLMLFGYLVDALPALPQP